MKHAKIAIIGAGFVGSTTAYALLLKKITAEIILIDINETRCHGEILDLSDACGLDGTSCIRSGTAHDASDADIIIIAAGQPQKPGQSRLDLLTINKAIITDIFTSISPINPEAIIIMVTNPLDALTSHAQTLSGLPHDHVFGTGTFLDTLRLREIIALKATISKESVNAYVIGEHGDSQVVVWSSADIAGTPLHQFPGMEQKDFAIIEQQVKDKAYDIIACKGATYFGIAACVATISEAIIFNQRLVIPLSVYMQQHNTYLSMPAVLGENGIEKIIEIPLNNEEQQKLLHSIEVLQKTC